MKKLLLVFPLLCALASAQINVQSSAPQIVVRNGASWTATSGDGSIANTYNVFLAANTTGLCLQFDNLDSVSHTVALSIQVSSNPNISTLAAGGTGIIGISVQSSPSTVGGVTITTGTSFKSFVPVGGASVAGITVVTGGGAGTNNKGNLTISQLQGTSNNCPDVFGSQLAPSTFFPCNRSVQATVASGTTVKLAALSGITATSSIHVCSFMVTVGGAAVAAVKNSFVGGTGATCGGGTVTLWPIQTGTTTAEVFALAAGSPGELFETAAASDLCYTDATTTAGSVVAASIGIW